MNTHPLRVGYLVTGLIFLGFAATWGLTELNVVDNPDPGLFIPITLVVAGAIGLLASAKRLFTPASRDLPNGNQLTSNHQTKESQ